MKKFIVGVTIASFAFFLALPADAAVSITKINDSSTVTSLATWLIDVLMNNSNNTLNVDNKVTSSANSGGNSHTSVDDHSGSTITTGDADSTSGVQNDGNQNALAEEYEGSAGPDVTVDDVNDDSTVSATTDDTLENDMLNENDVEVDNTVDAVGDSGTNTVTSGDSLATSGTTTGLSSAASGVLNGLNINIKSIIRRVASEIP